MIILKMEETKQNRTQELVANQSLHWRETAEDKMHRIFDTPQSKLQNKNQG